MTVISPPISYGVLTLALVGIITATYHARYEDLQNVPGIFAAGYRQHHHLRPGDCVSQSCRSVLMHVSMHLAAVMHSYESKDRLLPQVFVGSGK